MKLLQRSGTDQLFAFNGPRLLLAALLSAITMTLYMMFIPRWLGIEQMDIGITVGKLTSSSGLGEFLGRLSWHIGNAMIYLFPYAAILLRLHRQSKIGSGIVFGVFLWLAGPMLLIPVMLEPLSRVSSGELTNPGIFMLDLGLGWKPALVDLVAHVTHGAVAGVVYKHRVSIER